MNRRWAGLASGLVAVVVVVLLQAHPAAASHDDRQLWVTIAMNAAGQDGLSVTEDSFDSTNYVSLGSDVAIALGLPAGSFRATEDRYDGAKVVLDDKLARPSGRGGLSYALDSGKLQLLADRLGYDAVIIEVCTPRVRQVVQALVIPEASPSSSPGSRCRGWFQPVEKPPIRAVVQLLPDRDRYPLAVGRIVGTAAILFGLLGIGATLLRRGPMRRRSWLSWLLSSGVALLVISIGWGVVTLALWLSGAVADPMLLGRGSVEAQVARTLLPGLIFLLPALLPAALLLTVPAREKQPPRAQVPSMPAGPPPTAWWPTAWWPQWAAQTATRAPPHGPPSPPPADSPPFAGPPGPPPGLSSWAPPGSGEG